MRDSWAQRRREKHARTLAHRLRSEGEVVVVGAVGGASGTSGGSGAGAAATDLGASSVTAAAVSGGGGVSTGLESGLGSGLGLGSGVIKRGGNESAQPAGVEFIVTDLTVIGQRLEQNDDGRLENIEFAVLKKTFLHVPAGSLTW